MAYRISLEDKKTIKGRCIKKIKIPIDKIPIFAKSGSIIPSCPVKRNLSEKLSEIEFNVFPDKKTEFIYYEDDGLTEKYKEGGFLAQKISVVKSNKKIDIEIFPTSGSYDGCPEEIIHRLNVFLNGEKVKAVCINGQKSDFIYTDKILSSTVNSGFNFLNLDLGARKRNKKTKISIQI